MDHYLEFNKETSNAIKGIAILMMIFHHFFGFEDWILPSNMYRCVTELGMTWTLNIAVFCKLCVGIFAFVTGYSLFLKREDSFLKRWKRVGLFLLKYWFIFAIFLIIGYLVKEPLPGRTRLIEQCFGIYTGTGFTGVGHYDSYNTTINCTFAWYVSFFLAFHILFPVMKQFCRIHPIVDTIVIYGICYHAYQFILNQTYYELPYAVIAIAYRFSSFAPIGMLGYCFAKYHVFERLKQYIPDDHRILTSVMSCLVICGLVYLRQIRYVDLKLKLDVIYTPILIVCLMILIGNLRFGLLNKFLSLMQKNSTNIWFLHGIYFTPLCTFQWIPYQFHYPGLIFVAAVVTMLLASTVVEFVYNIPGNTKKRFFSKA